MMFPAHLAMGYLIGAYSRYPIPYLVAGSALPDLVDRPLYWLGLTPLPHTVGHSLVVAVPASVVLVYLFDQRGSAFAIGWLGHIATDILNILTTQGPAIAPFYGLYPISRPAGEDIFTAITIELPVTDITHTLHPGMLVAELVLVGWALLLFYRRR